MIVFTVIALITFAYLSWKHYPLGLAIFFGLLPTYLLRYHLGFLPTTFLEMMMWVLLIIFGIKNLNPVHWAATKNQFLNFWKKYPWLGGAIVLFLLGATINVLLAVNLRAALGEWRAFYVEPVILFFLLVITIKERKEMSMIVSALVLSGLVTSALAVYQHFTGWLVPHSFWANRNTYRVTAWYGFPNSVGLFLAPLLPLVVYLFSLYWQERGKISALQRCWWLGVSGISAIGIILAIIYSKSTGALVGLVVGLGVSLTWYKKTRWWTLMVGLVSILILFLLPSGNTLKQELLAKDRSGQIRREMWSETIEYLKIHPWRGAGLASYSKEIAPFRHNKKIEVFHHPHNIFLTMWVNVGLLGLLGFVGILLWFFTTAVQAAGLKIWLWRAVAIAMVVWLTMGLVDSPYIKNDLAMFFWLLIACLLILKENICQPGKAPT